MLAGGGSSRGPECRASRGACRRARPDRGRPRPARSGAAEVARARRRASIPRSPRRRRARARTGAIEALDSLLRLDLVARQTPRRFRFRHPIVRRSVGVESLSERELEVARLVVDRKTNPEIAGDALPQHRRRSRRTCGTCSASSVSPRASARARGRACRAAGICGHLCRTHQLAGGVRLPVS